MVFFNLCRIIYVMKKIITTDYYGQKYEADPDNMTVSIHVYGVAIDHDKALISPQFDGYDWPGGTFKLGEDTFQTLKREFKEETGLDIEVVKLLDVETSLFHHYKRGTDHHSILVFYLVKVVGGEITDVGFDEDEKEYAHLAEWVPIAELRKMKHACSINIADKILDLAINSAD